MTDLDALVLSAKPVEARRFSEASRRLKMPISTVSRRIAELEDVFLAIDLSIVPLANRHMPTHIRLFKEFAIQMAPTIFPTLPN